jgi:hypothetical protein
MNRDTILHALLLPAIFVLSGSVVAHAHPPAQVCGDFDSRLAVGDTALVVSPALNIREAPSTSADRLRDPLEPGTVAAILEGPRCVDEYTWWQVTAESITGWVAEGNPDEYFLSGPVDPDEVSPPQDSQDNQGSQGNFDTSGDANPNPPLETLDGQPGGGNYYYACEGGYNDSGVTGRLAFSEDNINNGGAADYRPFTHVLEVDTPAICFAGNAQYGNNAVAVAPNGQRLDPVVSQLYDEGSVYLTQIQLPLQAFIASGTWRLEVPGFVIDVNVRLPDHPYILFTLANGGQMLVAGLQSNERFILSGSAFGDYPEWFEARADQQGLFTLPLSQLTWLNEIDELDTNNLRRAVGTIDIIGQMGSFLSYDGITVTHPDTGYYWYRIPMRYGAPLMHEIIWGGSYDEASAQDYLRQWTCPGASPIRLNPDTSGGRAYVANGVGTQFVYTGPSLNAPVESSREPGDYLVFFGGVECADNGVWWSAGGEWIMENQGSQYFWVQ